MYDLRKPKLRDKFTRELMKTKLLTYQFQGWEEFGS